MNESLTRRQLLKRSGRLAGAGFGLAGCGASHAISRGDLARAIDVQQFVSRPDLTPPKVTLLHLVPDHELQYLFLGIANSGPAQGGAMIMDTTGQLIWFSPDRLNHSKMDFQRQIYRGRPVLTWFQGQIIAGGYGEGVGGIADDCHRGTHTTNGHNGL